MSWQERASNILFKLNNLITNDPDATVMESFSRVTRGIADAVVPIAEKVTASLQKESNIVDDLQSKSTEDGWYDPLTQEFLERWEFQVRNETNQLITEQDVIKRRTKRLQSRQPLLHESARDSTGNPHSRSESQVSSSQENSWILDDELVLEEIETALGNFEVVESPVDESDIQMSNLDHLSSKRKSKYSQKVLVPITASELQSWFNKEGQFISQYTPISISNRIIQTSVDPDTRPFLLLFVLGIFPWDSTTNDRMKIVDKLTVGYRGFETRWKTSIDSSISIDKADNSNNLKNIFLERKWRIEKDIVRTDRTMDFYSISSTATHFNRSSNNDLSANDIQDTDIDHGSNVYIQRQLSEYPRLADLRDILMSYTFFKIDVGYVQGMSDLVSPLYFMIYTALIAKNADLLTKLGVSNSDGELQKVLTFWMFVRLLNWNGELFDLDLLLSNTLAVEKSTKTYIHTAVGPQNHKLFLETNNLVSNFNMNQSGMRTRLMLLTYLLRLVDPQLWRALEEMEDINSFETNAIGPTSLIWVFRSLLVLFKREVSPLNTSSNDGFDPIIRLWESILTGRIVWSQWSDVWIVASMIILYVKPRILPTPYPAVEIRGLPILNTFETLLKYMNSELCNDVIVEEVIEKVPELLKILSKVVSMSGVPPVLKSIVNESISKQALCKLDKDCLLVDIPTWSDNGYWFLNRNFDDTIRSWAMKEGKVRGSIVDVDFSLTDAIWALTKRVDMKK